MKQYDCLVLGHVSKDIIVTAKGSETFFGGAVVHSAITARRIGANVAALTKLHPADVEALEVFESSGVPVIYRPSKVTTSIRNTYLTEDRERRTCEAISVAEAFEIGDIPEDVSAEMYYLGGLMRGEFLEELVAELAEVSRIAIDAQGFLRVNEGGPMVFRDWERKKQIISLVTYFKADAAEAEMLTGSSDCKKAARILRSWGAKEVLITENSGVTVCVGEEMFQSAFTSGNLSGRTGRGDTCFSAYCNWRKGHTPEEACLFAAALTSIKMEKQGAFSGSVKEVEGVISQRY
ncbi:MAG: hypothetical protein JXD22_16580 [Sedimentisphaerales bacterium]|nr:hypothetical protein [Sedimentisphaerales bacterium]